MAIDFSKTSHQIIVDLINQNNPALPDLEYDDVTFGAPAVDATQAGKDTKVVVTAAASSGFTGTRDIFYSRPSLASVPGARSTEFQIGIATNLSDLIPAINARYGINLGASDYVDVAIPAFPGTQPNDTQIINLEAAAGSLVWTGTLALTIADEDITLTDAIPNNVLNGLTYTPPA